MKNVVVLLNETGPETLSDNRLFAELTPEVAGRLLDFMLDHNVSELFPVDNRYELALFSYSKSQVDRLKMRLGDAFRYEWASVDSAGGLLDILADRFTGYDNLLILKSSSYGWEEHALAEIFSRLTECDGISAASGREDIYLLAMRLVDLPGMAHMKALTQSSLDEYSDAAGFHFYSMPGKPVAEDIDDLGRLRETLRAESGMARQIDAAVVQATVYAESDNDQ